MADENRVAPPRPMLWFAKDRPNLVSLAGLASALVGIYYAILGVYPAAMIGLVWAVVLDWLDGRIARTMSGRSEEQREFGGHVDSLIDVVSFGVAPAVLLLSVGGFSPWFLPGAFVALAAGVIRLAYFNTFGLSEGSTYRGLALDNNVIFLVLLFAFRPFIGEAAFAVVLYVALLVLAGFNIAPIRTPKLGGRWYFAVLAYAVVMTAVYSWQLVVLYG